MTQSTHSFYKAPLFPLINNYLTWAPGSQMSGVNFSGGYPKLFEGSLHIPLSSHPARRLPADGDPSYQLNFVVVTREPFLQPEKTTFGHWAVLVLVTT